MIASRARVPFGTIPAFSRAVSTLSSNPHIVRLGHWLKI